MASTEIKKVVRIETGDGERTVKSLRAEINELRDALLNMEQGGDEWVATARQLTDAQNDLNSVMRAGKGDIDATSDSIVGMEQQYKSLYNTYKLLGEEARNSAEGIAMKDQLSELSANLNSAKQDAGNFKDNIGHYSEDIQKAFAEMGRSVKDLNDPFKMAGGGVQALGKSFKALIANPVGAVIMAIVVALKLLKNALDSSTEAQEALEDAMDAFRPIVEGVNKVLVEVIKCYSDVAKAVGNFITKLFGVKDAADKANAAVRGLKDAQAELNAQEAQSKVYIEARERTIRDLREQLDLTTDMTKREALLNRIKHEQDEIDKENLNNANNRLEVAQGLQRSAQIDYDNALKMLELHPNSKKALEEKTKAYEALQGAIANTANAQASYNSTLDTNTQNTKKLNEEIGKTKNGINTSKSGLKSAAKDAKKQLDEILERLKNNSKTEVELLTEKYKKEKALLEKYHKDTTKLTEEYQDNLRKRQNQYNSLVAESIEKQLDTVEKLTYPSANYFETVLPVFQTNLELANNLYKEFFAQLKDEEKKAFENIPEEFHSVLKKGMDRIKQTGDLGDILLDVDNDNVKDFLKKYGKEVSDFLEDFNSKVIGINPKFFVEFPDILKVSEREFLNLRQESEEYQKTLNALADENFRLGVSFENVVSRFNRLNEGLESNADYFKYMKAQYDVEEQALRDHISELEEQFSIYQKYGFDNEQQQLEFMQEMANAKLELEEYYLEKKIEYREREAELDKQAMDDWMDLGSRAADAIGSISNSISELIKDELQEGKVSKQEAEKKKKTLKALEAVQLAVSLAGIAGDAAAGIMGVWKSYGQELALNAETAAAAGPAAAAVKAALDAKSLTAAILRTVGLGTTAAAAATAAITKSVANFKSINGMGESEAAGSSAVPQMIDSTPYSYTRTLQTDVEKEQELNRPIYVRVTDINEMQNRVRVVDEEASF